jgi:hypothetical protein
MSAPWLSVTVPNIAAVSRVCAETEPAKLITLIATIRRDIGNL